MREYLREQKERANDTDLKMQLLAEFGPQNIEDAWKYFKHWVKGRPLSDAVALPARFDAPAYGTRSDVGHQMPQRMHAYDPDPSDRQPEVYATDRHAYNPILAQSGGVQPVGRGELLEGLSRQAQHQARFWHWPRRFRQKWI